MKYDKISFAIKLCGSTPKYDQCKECPYFAGGDMSKCIPRMTMDAAAAITDLLVYNKSLRKAANRFKDRTKKAINDIYGTRPCTICANYRNDKCWECRGINEKYHPDFKWQGNQEGEQP